jgi:hypothetical protein
MQVDAEATFCIRIEQYLKRSMARDLDTREAVCENFGVSATDLLEYWHRIIHDVLQPEPPHALVLCLYPGNDFRSVLPDDAFDDNDRPVRDYYRNPPWTKHVITWINLHSQFGSYLQRVLFSIGTSKTTYLSQGPRDWWTDPKIAGKARGAVAIRRSRAILASIDDECRRLGTKLVLLIVGPVADYRAIAGASPIEQIVADWGLEIPVIDVAIEARSRPNWACLVFPNDGHLTEGGHDYLARAAAPRLRSLMIAPLQ